MDEKRDGGTNRFYIRAYVESIVGQGYGGREKCVKLVQERWDFARGDQIRKLPEDVATVDRIEGQ